MYKFEGNETFDYYILFIKTLIIKTLHFKCIFIKNYKRNIISLFET